MEEQTFTHTTGTNVTIRMHNQCRPAKWRRYGVTVELVTPDGASLGQHTKGAFMVKADAERLFSDEIAGAEQYGFVRSDR